MKVISFVAVSAVIAAMAIGETEGCDFSILMYENDRGYEFTADGYDLKLTPYGNFQVTNPDDDVIYDNQCYCEEKDCDMQIKFQDDGHVIVLPEGQDNVDLIWKSFDVGPREKTFALLVNHDDDDKVQVWEMVDDCIDTLVWNNDLGVCEGSKTKPPDSTETTDPVTTIDPTNGCEDFTILMETFDHGTKFSNNDYDLEVIGNGNLIVTDPDGDTIYTNKCKCLEGEDCDMEVKIQDDGHVIVLPLGTNDNKLFLWKSLDVGPNQNVYGLVVNHGDNDAVQVWRLADGCPVELIWDEDEEEGDCAGEYGNGGETTDPITTIGPTNGCEDSTLLVLTYEHGHEFSVNDYDLLITDKGNLLVTNPDGDPIYDNECYCEDVNDCVMEVKVQDDGHVIVLPEGLNNNNLLLWKSLDVGPYPDLYALLVNHGEDDRVQVWRLADGCPVELIWDEDEEEGFCAGTKTKPVDNTTTTIPVTTITPTCNDDDFTILMNTHDRGVEFTNGDYKLEVTDNGNIFVKDTTKDNFFEGLLFDNQCWCEDLDCEYIMEVKLQDDGHLIVLPVDHKNVDLMWKSEAVGPAPNDYALVVNHAENDEVQIWQMEDGCPLLLIWDGDIGVCEGGTRDGPLY